jgi:hypothetical protein
VEDLQLTGMTPRSDRLPSQKGSIVFGIASVKIGSDARMQGTIDRRLARDRAELKKDIPERRRAWLEMRVADYLKCQQWLSKAIRERDERATK